MEQRRFTSRRREPTRSRALGFVQGLNKEHAIAMGLWGFLVFIVAALVEICMDTRPAAYLPETSGFAQGLLTCFCGIIKDASLGAMALGLIGAFLLPRPS